MKKIGIDARLINQTGVGVYLRNFLFYLQREPLEEIQLYVYLMDEDYDSFSAESTKIIKRRVRERWHNISEQTTFLGALYKDNLDLMHFTYFSYPILYRRKFIATIHDLTPLLFKTGKSSTKNPMFYLFKHFVFSRVLKMQVNNAHVVITPTHAVKDELVHHYGHTYASKIVPIYEGVNRELQDSQENTDLKKEFSKDFFIYVGNFYPHKNIERLVTAFSKIQEDIQLVLLGPEDYFTNKIKAAVKYYNQQHRIRLFCNPSIRDLVFFYKNAKALIHPSLSEGFGLPLVEAMHFNLPIIASNIPVFKEILDHQYLTFEPTDIDSITSKIMTFLKKPTEFDYSHIISKFSFQKMTKEILAIYKNHV